MRRILINYLKESDNFTMHVHCKIVFVEKVSRTTNHGRIHKKYIENILEKKRCDGNLLFHLPTAAKKLYIHSYFCVKPHNRLKTTIHFINSKYAYTSLRRGTRKRRSNRVWRKLLVTNFYSGRCIAK
jgi:hypothetical protein